MHQPRCIMRMHLKIVFWDKNVSGVFVDEKNHVQMQVDHEDGGLVLEIINLPEAMKLHTENVFEGV